MAAQIHMAGSTWIRVSRQLVSRSFTPMNSIAKPPTIRARGASHRRERLSRKMISSPACRSLSLMASISRWTCARRAVHPEAAGCSGAFPSIANVGMPFVRSEDKPG